MDSDELLEMKLCDVSDLLLEKLCESGNDFIKFDLPGCNVKSRERFVLRVMLCKGDLE
jgi:hypothetical protein